MRARARIIASAPILAWRRAEPDAAIGHAPTYHRHPLVRSNCVHTLLCRGSGLPHPVCMLKERIETGNTPPKIDSKLTVKTVKSGEKPGTSENNKNGPKKRRRTEKRVEQAQ
jgi:hypothetical protein